MRVLRVYIDTSVLGGCFDEPAPEKIRAKFEEILAQSEFLKSRERP
jgi:hypothetical protein